MRIVAEAVFVPMVALVGDERRTEKVSSASISASPATSTVMVLELSPLAKESEPPVVMKSSAVASPVVEPSGIDH